MRFSNPTTLLLMTTVLFASAGLAHAEDLTAREIMERVDARDTGDSSEADAQLILIDKKDRERVRDLRMLSLEDGDTTKSITFFRSPTDVAGTAYLSFDHDDADRDDDAWLYLPALKQVRRIAAGDRSGSFMGSDFSYSDLNGPNIDWYDYTLLSADEEVNGHPAWRIESVPKPEYAERVLDETGYERSELWIRKDNFVQVQAKIQVNKGGRIKYFSARELEQIDGIWTAKRIQMITTRNGEREHASVFQIQRIDYNEHNDANLFTTQAMQQGIQ